MIGVVLGTKIFGLEEGLKSVLDTLYLRTRKRTDIDDRDKIAGPDENTERGLKLNYLKSPCWVDDCEVGAAAAETVCVAPCRTSGTSEVLGTCSNLYTLDCTCTG